MGWIKEEVAIPTLTTLYRDVRCDKCNVELELVFDNVYDSDKDGNLNPKRFKSLQYSGALVIDFSGGYGMFFDNMDQPSKSDSLYTKILCKDCAKELVNFFTTPTVNQVGYEV